MAMRLIIAVLVVIVCGASASNRSIAPTRTLIVDWCVRMTGIANAEIVTCGGFVKASPHLAQYEIQTI